MKKRKRDFIFSDKMIRTCRYDNHDMHKDKIIVTVYNTDTYKRGREIESAYCNNTYI
jgi:hypothetical protein